MKKQHIIPAAFAAFAICGGAFAATVAKWAGDARGASATKARRTKASA